MSSSLLKASNVVQYKEGTINVASDTIVNAASVDTSDTDAYYLLIGVCFPPEATNTAKYIQARLTNCITKTALQKQISANAVTVVKGNGGNRNLGTAHNYGSAIDITYKFVAIKLN